MRIVHSLFLSLYLLASKYTCLAADKGPITLEPHPNNQDKLFTSPERENIQKIIIKYAQAVASLPDDCRALRFIYNFANADNIPGNTQDLSIVLIHALSFDIQTILSSMVANDPRNTLKTKGVFIAAQAHDSLLDSLKITESLIEKFTEALTKK